LDGIIEIWNDLPLKFLEYFPLHWIQENEEPSQILAPKNGKIKEILWMKKWIIEKKDNIITIWK
jgi:hypothetical protein